MNYATHHTPIGPFTVISDTQGTVLASGFTPSVEELQNLISPTIRPTQLTECTDLGNISAAVNTYFDGDLELVKQIPVKQNSGKFIEYAWKQLRNSGVGEVMTYSELAAISNRPKAIRAAAQACANNAAALFIPCHRVIRLDGTLGGFRYGLTVKQWLLDYEQDQKLVPAATTTGSAAIATA